MTQTKQPQTQLLTAQDWRVVGAAVQGTSHQKRKQPCQDAFDYRSGLGWLAIAVADGAGSARRAERGSQRAVVAALDAIVTALRAPSPWPREEPEWRNLVLTSFARARQAVHERARLEHHALRDYATTLTVAVAAGDWLAVGQIGDGAVVAVEPSGTLVALTRLQKGEYANETHFLIQRDALERVQLWAGHQRSQTLAVMSDGLVRLALQLPSGQPHVPFFQPLFRFALAQAGQPQAERDLSAFLSSERVCSRTDDDKTLVLAVRTPLTAELP